MAQEEFDSFILLVGLIKVLVSACAVLFVAEHSLFQLCSSRCGESAEAIVCGEDAVAGDYQREGIFGEGVAYRSCCFWLADLVG